MSTYQIRVCFLPVGVFKNGNQIVTLEVKNEIVVIGKIATPNKSVVLEVFKTRRPSDNKSLT